MLNNIQHKLSLVQSEFAYKAALKKSAKNLPVLAQQDQIIVDTLKREGVCVTSLEALGLTSTPHLLSATKKYLSTMADVFAKKHSNSSQSNSQVIPSRPQIFTVTDLPEFFSWGMEERLLKIIENYIGLPIAFQGVHLRRDFNNPTQVGTQLWHKDGEDRRIVKMFIYLTDVSKEHGPFEYIPRSITASKLLSWQIYHKIWKSGFLGINDEEIKQIVPESQWKSCPGPAGTVIFVDTQSVYHHGTLRKAERASLFYVYTAKQPKRPDLCTQYSNDTYARPELIIQPSVVKN